MTDDKDRPRYMLFSFEDHNSLGGIHDFIGFYESIDDAIAYLSPGNDGDWTGADILDLTTLQTCELFWSKEENKWVHREWSNLVGIETLAKESKLVKEEQSTEPCSDPTHLQGFYLDQSGNNWHLREGLDHDNKSITS